LYANTSRANFAQKSKIGVQYANGTTGVSSIEIKKGKIKLEAFPDENAFKKLIN
tara:strand:- start:46 stop:207 length:162 start_codon:yes stop_codon:yes gene_type:complete